MKHLAIACLLVFSVLLAGCVGLQEQTQETGSVSGGNAIQQGMPDENSVLDNVSTSFISLESDVEIGEMV
ncbi:MAG: hypothetical protein NTU61_03545 [Candidatus Altiarchaeota archaeon]|nr:hypothetical protein [Candidatus Altiarchaeota archaeon]